MFDLWQHQKEDIPRFINILNSYGGAFMCYDMGCGKTRTAIELIKRMGVKRCTIFAPLVATKSVWETQWNQWNGDSSTRVFVLSNSNGRKELLRSIINTYDSYVLVLNYEALRTREIFDLLSQTKQDMLVLDESHRVKSHTAKIGKDIFDLVAKFRVYRYRLALSGTPFTSHKSDLWNQVKILNNAIFNPNYNSFLYHYFKVFTKRNEKNQITYMVPGKWKDDIVYQEFLAQFGKVGIIRKAADCLELPEINVVDVPIYLNKALVKNVNALYSSWKINISGKGFSGTIEATNRLTASTRCLQLSNGIVKLDGQPDTEYLIDNSKFEYLEEMLESFDERVVIFCQWIPDLIRLKGVCNKLKRKYFEISGPAKGDRAKFIYNWRQSSNGVIGVQFRAGAESIDLTDSRVAIVVSRDMSWSTMLQAVKRVHRFGQNENTLIYQLIANTRIEQAQIKALRAKGEDASDVDRVYKRLFGG